MITHQLFVQISNYDNLKALLTFINSRALELSRRNIIVNVKTYNKTKTKEEVQYLKKLGILKLPGLYIVKRRKVISGYTKIKYYFDQALSRAPIVRPYGSDQLDIRGLMRGNEPSMNDQQNLLGYNLNDETIYEPSFDNPRDFLEAAVRYPGWDNEEHGEALSKDEIERYKNKIAEKYSSKMVSMVANDQQVGGMAGGMAPLQQSQPTSSSMDNFDSGAGTDSFDPRGSADLKRLYDKFGTEFTMSDDYNPGPIPRLNNTNSLGADNSLYEQIINTAINR